MNSLQYNSLSSNKTALNRFSSIPYNSRENKEYWQHLSDINTILVIANKLPNTDTEDSEALLGEGISASFIPDKNIPLNYCTWVKFITPTYDLIYDVDFTFNIIEAHLLLTPI